MTSAARSIVDDHERTLDERARTVDGAVPTPAPLAADLVRRGMAELPSTPSTVLDPACGAGALLLAAADELVRRGVEPREIVERRLIGIERDPAVAAVARLALQRWLADHESRADVVARVHVGDGLAVTAGRPGPLAAGGVDLIVANPPFLDQLDRRSRRSAAEREWVAERFGPVGPYCDTAALFLAASLDQVRPGGVVSMLLPTSFLSARDATAVRERVVSRATLASFWGSDESCVPASVQVCSVTVCVGDADPTASVDVFWRDSSTPVATVAAPSPDGSSWSPFLAAARGIPCLQRPVAPQLDTLATVTAGFRDEFYAICDALESGPRDVASIDAPGRRCAPVVSVGMIDPAELRWSEGEWRMGGRRRVRPTVDLHALESAAPATARWVHERRRPKVLVASQGRVIEAVADEEGAFVPLTPVISVEPRSSSTSPWLLLAALTAPPVAAAVAAERCGSGLSGRSFRVSAATLAAVPLPLDATGWFEGGELARRAQGTTGERKRSLLWELGVTMTRAHGVDDESVVGWWWEQIGAS